MSRSRGRLIVLEGQESAGKSTQAPRLLQWLTDRGVDAMLLREPGGTDAGEKIREMVLHVPYQLTAAAEALLFMASRAELVDRVIKPALRDGRTVILDRFFLSTYAYQVAGRGLDAALVASANALATQGLIPDLTVVLTLSARERRARLDRRGGHDKIERESDQFHSRVDAAFERFLEPAWQANHPEAGPIVGIDGAGTEDEVLSRIAAAIAQAWPETFAVSSGFHHQ
ncbi:MAG TPA: dTMP kinase [Gemmatimonadaceae bacterium]|nr:dTMP kinase [Gemmatimonadaceae bacterium]